MTETASIRTTMTMPTTSADDTAPTDIPWMISVDDHILEPRDLWARELPVAWRERGPRVSRERAKLGFLGGKMSLDRGATDGQWCDIWLYDDLVMPTGLLHAPVGMPPEQQANVPAIYEDFRAGAWDQTARLLDMDLNHVEASINYPNTFPRFAGQGFAERGDKDLALACLQIYNDWIIDEWGGGAGRGRLIPLTLVPLWDPVLAAAEVRRCAAKGSYAIAFTENPAKLGFSSLYTGLWDVLWDACEETDTTVSMHIGSSSTMPTTSDDAPLAVSMSLNSQNAQGSLCDWVFSRTLERFPKIKLAYAESQVGWMPFLLERMDGVWHEDVGGVELAHPPSSYVRNRVYGCIFDDLHGLRSRDEVGMDIILFESDYPHMNGTWPHSADVVRRMVAEVGLSPAETTKLVRGNAITCYGLDRFAITR